MADEQTQAPAAPAAPAPAADAADRSNEPLRNYQEVVDLKKDVRGIEKLLKEQILPKLTAPAPAPAEAERKVAADAAPSAMDEVNKLRREIAVERAFNELGIKPEHRERLIKAVDKVDPADVKSFLSDLKGAFGPAETPIPEPKKAARSDTGVPSADGSNLPDDPHLVPPEIWSSPTFDRVGHMARWSQINGGSGMWGRKSQKR